MFALIDCNSFYCSCERVFNPKIRNKPLIVLSNNDGVTISRSDEAKALGIKMGEPYHKIKDLLEKNKVYVYSSNYTLYGDLSARVMHILSNMSPELEIYSIDEAFLKLDGIRDPVLHGENIYKTIQQWTGIPVCVGIGQTKVLAKLANRIAKKQKYISPVFDISDKDVQETSLAKFPVEDIWGIGRQSAAKLKNINIHTAKELRDADPFVIQKLLTIVGRNIQQELQGIECMELELVPKSKKQIISSRSFSHPVFQLSDLKEAVASYVSTAAEKLREQDSICAYIQVFVHTNRFKNTTQYYNSASVKIPVPTSSTVELIKTAHRALETIFKKGIEYKKAGVILNDIMDREDFRFALFDDKEAYVRNESLMKVMDQINNSFGSNVLRSASCGGTKSHWKMRSQMRSSCYTTRWSDLLKI